MVEFKSVTIGRKVVKKKNLENKTCIKINQLVYIIFSYFVT